MNLVKKIITSLVFILSLNSSYANPAKDSLKYGIFGQLYVYKPQGEIKSIALFVSGDGGWNTGVIEMAKSIAQLNTLVVGVDITHYFKMLNNEKTAYIYPASDFEELSKYIQKFYKLKNYIQPVLVGYSSGATLVYALLAEAPAGTFAGGLSLGFCPDIEIKKPLHKGVGLEFTPIVKPQGYMLQPFIKLATPWYILHGDIDKVCDIKTCGEFVAKIPIAHFIPLHKVGHGFSVQKNWLPEFKQAYNDILDEEAKRIAAAEKSKQENHEQYHDDLSDLPITVTTSTVNSNKTALAIIISGDGGWTDFDQTIANTLASNGIPSVGLSSLNYFWSEKKPDKASQDLLRMIKMYMNLWNRQDIILVGYSYGADVLPFMTTRLPQEIKQNIKCIALLSPSPTVDFEFHISGWFSNYSTDDDYKTLPEIQKLDPLKILVVYGDDEDASMIKTIPDSKIKLYIAPGGHHYDNNVSKIVSLILTYI